MTVNTTFYFFFFARFSVVFFLSSSLTTMVASYEGFGFLEGEEGGKKNSMVLTRFRDDKYDPCVDAKVTTLQSVHILMLFVMFV